MKRILLALAATALAACGGSSTPRRDVVVYWEFLRHTLTAQQSVGYDVNVNVGGGDAACAESAVEYVTITDEAGRVVNPELEQIPCVFQGVQGATIAGIRTGRHTWTITGYRGSVPVFATTATFDVTSGGANQFSAILEGIRDDLDLNVAFLSQLGISVRANGCAAAGVQSLAYNLVDGAGTIVATGEVSCGVPAGLFFRAASGGAVDRDDYSVRVQAFASPTAIAPLYDSSNPFFTTPCQAQTFQHFGPQTGGAGAPVSLYYVEQNPAGQPNNSFCQ